MKTANHHRYHHHHPPPGLSPAAKSVLWALPGRKNVTTARQTPLTPLVANSLTVIPNVCLYLFLTHSLPPLSPSLFSVYLLFKVLRMDYPR